MNLYKISRYAFIFISVFVLAVLLPKIFWLSVEKPVMTPFIRYSCMLDEFVIRSKSDEGKNIYYTASQKKLTLKEFQQALPFLYFRSLISHGTMPTTIKGEEMDAHDINMTNSVVVLKKGVFDKENYKIFPIFTENATGGGLELDTVFLKNAKHELLLINSNTNRTLSKESQELNELLSKNYFQFPAKLIVTNHSATKKFDDGFLMVDLADHLYRLHFRDQHPNVEIIRIPPNLKIKHIQPVEINSKEYSHVIISQSNDVYVLLNTGNIIQQVPVSNYNPQTDFLHIYGNMFHKNVIVRSENSVTNTTLDLEYNPLDSYTANWPKKEDTSLGRLAAFIFPFEMNFESNGNPTFFRFYIRYPNYKVLFLNVILALFLLYFIHASNKNKTLNNSILSTTFQLIFVLCFGLFALPGILLIPNNAP